MPLLTALSMIETASLTRFVASPAFASTALRAFFTAVRIAAIAARLRARFLIILRFCFSAERILATALDLLRDGACNPGAPACQRPTEMRCGGLGLFTRISVEKSWIYGSTHRWV